MSVALVVPERYTPREQFSPSGLELLAQCGHKWGLRYIRGIKEAALPTWDEVSHLERPAKPKPTDSAFYAAELRAELKEYNRLTRRALGHAVHFVSQVHYDWHPPLREVDWDDRPAILFMAGLSFLPLAEHCETLWLEEELSFEVGPRSDPLALFGFVDIVVKFKRAYGGRWKLYDLKSTYSFGYCKTPDELRDDVQSCFYALALMLEHDLTELECRWVYFLTDETKQPDARAVDFTITREHAEYVLRAHSRRALEGREAMRASPRERRTLSVLQPNGLSCGTYGGCIHKGSVFCTQPKVSKGALAAAADAQRELLQKRRDALKNGPGPTGVVAHRKALRGSIPPGSTAASMRLPRKKTRMSAPKNRFTEQLARETGGDPPDDEGATRNDEPEEKPARRARGSEQTREAPPARRNAAAKPSKAKTEAPSVVSVTVDGVSFDVPAGTPLHRRAVSVANALFAE